jgi:hypothetical protein
VATKEVAARKEATPDRKETLVARNEPVALPKEAVMTRQEAPKELANVELVHPKPGVAYVQVGAFISPYAELWVSVLQQRGFHPVVAEGPNSAVHRVLLGPFGPSEVPQVESRLRQAGIEHFERVY